MSFADEGELERFVYRDDMLPKVTAEAVADALDGFPLQCRCSMDWLATAVRRALAITIRAAGDRPDRQSNRKTKKELETLASRAAKAWLSIQERSAWADSAAWDFAWRNSPLEGETTIDGLTIGEPSAYRRFSEALTHLDWLSSFLRDTAKAIEKQAPRWPEAEARQIRIERAEYLAPIYKTAFGLDELIRFGDFYQRMVALAFDEGDIPDLEALMSEARRRHSETPAAFGPGAGIPEPY
jgi:hypothetical protein